MINRLKAWTQEPEDRPPPADYFEIVCDAGIYYIPRDEAVHVARLLARRWPPRWIRFSDIFGADVRILRRTITALCESTEALREQEREFRRVRRDEDREDWW